MTANNDASWLVVRNLAAAVHGDAVGQVIDAARRTALEEAGQILADIADAERRARDADLRDGFDRRAELAEQRARALDRAAATIWLKVEQEGGEADG